VTPSTAFDVRLRRARYTPLGATLRERFALLFVVCILGTAVAYAALARLQVDLLAAAPVVGSGVPLVTPGPLDLVLLRVETALLLGLTATLVAVVVLCARDDDRVSLAEGWRQFALAAVVFVGGAALGRLFLVPHLVGFFVLDGVGALPGVSVGAGGAGSAAAAAAAVSTTGLAELGLFLPVAVGLGASLPVLTVGAVEAGLAPRYSRVSYWSSSHPCSASPPVSRGWSSSEAR
jgi:Sec-independent protein secretion pathway component TatC